MIEVEFTQEYLSPIYGRCRPGTVVRVDEKTAAHVVNEIKAGRYRQPPQEKATKKVRK